MADFWGFMATQHDESRKKTKIGQKRRFFSNRVLDFELLKQVPESSHQTGTNILGHQFCPKVPSAHYDILSDRFMKNILKYLERNVDSLFHNYFSSNSLFDLWSAIYFEALFFVKKTCRDMCICWRWYKM